MKIFIISFFNWFLVYFIENFLGYLLVYVSIYMEVGLPIDIKNKKDTFSEKMKKTKF